MDEQPSLPHTEPMRRLAAVRSAAITALVFGIMETIYGQITAPPGQLKLNVMFVLIGLALYYGNARVIGVLRWLALFAVIPAIVTPVQQLLIAPLELTLVQLRLYPMQVAAFYVPLAATAVVACLIARWLNSDSVQSELRSRARTVRGPRLPRVLGAVLTLGTTIFLFTVLHGEDAQQAARMAEKQLGPKYHYFTSHLFVMNGNGTTVYATVQLWNSKEALQVPVKWSR